MWFCVPNIITLSTFKRAYHFNFSKANFRVPFPKLSFLLCFIHNRTFDVL